MGDNDKRVTLDFLGEGTFDPYGMNLNLPYMTTIISSNKFSMDVDGQGIQGANGIVRV